MPFILVPRCSHAPPYDQVSYGNDGLWVSAWYIRLQVMVEPTVVSGL
jgi:hypothetical protein